MTDYFYEHADIRPEWLRVVAKGKVFYVNGERVNYAMCRELRSMFDLKGDFAGYVHHWQWEDKDVKFHTDDEMLEAKLISA